MALKTDQELANTRQKLELLKNVYHETEQDISEDATAREITLQSLLPLISQLQTEITAYETAPPVSET